MLSYADGVAVAEFVVYVPAFAIAILLLFRHGFGVSSGWRFVVVFTLARLIQAGMQLGTLAAPTSKSLYIGIVILLGVAVSPLELASLGLLSRLISNINRKRKTIITILHMQIIQVVNLIGLILAIVGGDLSGNNLGKTGVYTVHPLTKAGLALFIVSFVAIAGTTAYLATERKYAAHGEHRVLLALALSLPFLLIRIIYSCVSTFGGVHSFSLYGGNETILLCMGLLMEFCIIVIYEATGITLKKVPHEEPKQRQQATDAAHSDKYLRS